MARARLSRRRTSSKNAKPNCYAAMEINPTTEQRRQAYLDALYERSGRTCGTYTGLYQERLAQLVERDMQELTSDLL